MRRLGWIVLGTGLVASAARCGYPSFTFDGNGGAGGGGGGAGTTSMTHSSSGAVSSSTSSGASSSSTSSSSTSSSSTSSSSTSSSTGGPTCASVHGTYGCCNQIDQVYFCNDGVNVMSLTCALGDVCTWDPVHTYYNCGSPPPFEDPSHPIACGM